MKILLFLLIMVQTFLLAQDSHLEEVKLQLPWKYQFQFAGFIMAKELGYYKDVGLDVTLLEYKNTDIIQDLEAAKIDYALTNSLINYHEKKLHKVTLVATYLQKSPLILITQNDIKSIMDLKNKTIMMSQSDRYNSSLSILFEYFKIDSSNNTFLFPSYNLKDFIEKRVDVITGFRSNELFLLNKKNIQYNIIDPLEHGFSTNAINLFVSHKKIDTNPQQIDDFLSASKKGWEYALNNIEEVAKLIHAKYQTNKSIEHLIYEGNATKDLMLLNLYRLGEVNKNFVLKTYDDLIKSGYLDKNQASDKLFLKRENLQLWIKEQYIQRTEYTFAILIASFFLILLMLILFWSLKMKKEITKRVKAELHLKHQEEYDTLTNLPNRSLCLDRLSQAMKSAKRNNTKIAVLYLDLDHFKEINDSVGRTVGDILLQKIAKTLSRALHDYNTVARVGGDEFIIIDNFSNFDALTDSILNLFQSFKKPFTIENQELYVALSLGISVYPNDGVDPDTLMKNAEVAMYKAKENGRNNYQFYTANMTTRAFERVVLETQLRQSIEQKQLEVHYQIQVDTQRKVIIGMEALVRWNHPLKGLLLPAEFIPLAEEIGFIAEIDTWVMHESIAQYKKWFDDGYEPGSLSLNLSILRLEDKDFVQSIENLLQNGVHADCLSFELTETQIMKDPGETIKSLYALSALGIKLSIDDFGTGYSSLSYLKKLPIDKLKIDGSFIQDIPHDRDDKEITKTIIAMAKNLHMSVIAEGVETQEQSDFLLENGCSEIQGFLYHKPSPAHEIKDKLQNMFK